MAQFPFLPYPLSMRILSFSGSSVAEDLALEEALQLGLEAGSSPPTWRLWQAVSPALVLGTGQEAAQELDLEAARAAGVPVLRRHSGGGAVLIGPGVINYSGFFRIHDLPGAETISGAMQAALQPVLHALAALCSSNPKSKIQNPKFVLAGLSDIAVRAGDRDGPLRKIAGHAQARKRVSVLVHGTLLADPDWGLLERLLKSPSRPPEYRGTRSHRDFLISLKELGAPTDLGSFKETLRAVCGPALELASAPAEAELTGAQELLEKKYARDEWNLRR